MHNYGVTLTKLRRRFLYKHYKFSLIKYILKFDHDWDYAYFLELIYKKLTNMALVIRKEEITMADKKIAHQIWTARKILKKVLYYDYDEEQEIVVKNKLIKKYRYYIDYETNIGANHRLDFNYFPAFEFKNSVCTITGLANVGGFDKALEEYHLLTRESYTLSFEEKKKDLKLFFDCLVEHIWGWAD